MASSAIALSAPNSQGHCGQFSVGPQPANTWQLLFVASQWGRPDLPAELDRVLFRITLINDGPHSVRVFWDNPPPFYGVGMPSSGQDALVPPGDSLTITACRSVAVAYEPSADSGIAAQGATGTYVVSWCCPPAWGAGQPSKATASFPPLPPVPKVTLFDPVDLIGPQVPVRFILENPTNEPCDVACEYSLDSGATWLASTAASTSDATATLPAPYLGADYRFIWDALHDVGTVKPADNVNALFRIVPSNAGVTGDIGHSNSFQLDTTSKSAVQPPSIKQPVIVSSISIDPASAAQTGISGQLLPNSLRARVLDQAGKPIPGAAVTFTVTSPASVAGAPAKVLLERDPAASTTADAQGWASIRLRIAPGQSITGGLVSVAVAGADPSISAAIPFTADQTRILTDPGVSPPPQVGFGSPFPIQVGLVTSTGTLLDPPPYLLEPANPIRLLVTGSGVQLSHSELHLPDPNGLAPVTLQVALLEPTFSGATGSAPWVQIAPADPASKIPPVKISLIPESLATISRDSSVTLQGSIQTTTLSAYLKPDPAIIPTWPVPLVGYPGLTLKQKFRLQFLDSSGHQYKQELTSASPSSGCNGQPPPATQPLSISWHANGGYFSIAGGALQNPLTATIGQSVSFQPSGPGPWIIQAATNGDGNPTFDDLHVSCNYVNPANPAFRFCIDNYSIPGLSGLYTFLVQEAPRARLVLNGAPLSAPAYATVRTGDSVHIEIAGLSDTSGGTPDPITLSALNANLGTPGEDGPNRAAYSGTALPYPLEQKIPLTFANGVLTSKNILFIPTNPQSPPASDYWQPAIPRGWMRAQADGLVLHLPVAGSRASRRLIGAVESQQESPVGSSIQTGAANTVFAHNGELSFLASDLTVLTRAGNISMARVFRGHLDSDGILGPGWSHEHEASLDVSSVTQNSSGAFGYLRWLCLGRIDHFAYDFASVAFAPPKGFFVAVTTHSAVDDTTSAFEIKDAHQNVIHFNPDGTMRFIKDRLGNLTSYAYNQKSQLISITDPHGRKITLSYRPDGKLSQVAFLQRVIDFAYFPPNSAGDILLQRVTLPAAPTLLSTAAPGADPNPSYRRSESYTYTGTQLATIADSEGRTWLDMSSPAAYDQQNRVQQQRLGTATQPFVFDYATPLTTRVTDRLQYKTSFQFERSPFPDGACATTFIDQLQNKSTFQFNLDGHLIQSVAASGDQALFVYNDDPAKTQATQRGNLLTVIRTNPSTGDTRAWSFEYEGNYNFVARTVGPRGNAPGVNPEIYARHLLYDIAVRPSQQVGDPDLTAGNQGSLVRVSSPRALHMTIVPFVSGPQMNWIDANQQEVFKYNKFGLCIWHRDPQGVVTRYTYFPDKTPTSGADSADGGGFMATATRDAENNWLRDGVFFPHSPQPDPRVTRWTYDDLGHVASITDNAHNVTTIETNDLHELTRMVLPSAAGSGSAQPATIDSRFGFNSSGIQAQTRLVQSNPAPTSGGALPFDHLQCDVLGNPGTLFSVSDSSQPPGKFSFTHDDNDHPLGVFPFDVQAGVCASGGSGVQRDPRGLPTTNLNAIPPGLNPQGLLDDTIGWTVDGRFDHLKEAGAAGSWQLPRDGIGLPSAVVDPLSYALRLVHDDAGKTNRLSLDQKWTSTGSGPSLRCEQTRLNECGRPGRGHSNVFVSSTAPTPATPAPEYMGPRALWSPQVGTPIAGGLWGRPFACATTDAVHDGWDLPARIVGDELGFTTIQRDTHGRLASSLLFCGPTADLSNTVRQVDFRYDDAGFPKLVTITDTPPPSSFLFSYAYQLSYDPIGRPVKVIDAEGNAQRVEYDETGHLYASYDAMGATPGADGNSTTFTRDGHGNLTRSATILTVDGKGGSAQDKSNPFNPDGVVSFQMDWSADGRPLKNTDHTDLGDFITQWNYAPYGRLEFIQYADGTKFQYHYDPATGRVTSTTDGNQNVVSFGFDDVRLRSVTSQGQGYAFDYDATATTISAAQSGGGATFTKGRAIQVVHDSLHRVVREVQDTTVVATDFSGLGTRTLKYPDNHGNVAWTFDNIGRLNAIFDRGVQVVSVHYSGPSRVLSSTNGSLRTAFTYSGKVPRLTGITVTNSTSGKVLADYTIARDAMNRILSRTRTASGITETKVWTYDSSGRITHEAFTPAPARAPGVLNTTLQYDGDSVLRKLTRDRVQGGMIVPNAVSVTQTRGERGRILTRTGAVLQYDKNGNLIGDATQQYGYDGFNRLTSVTLPGHSITFAYDGMNRVISRTDSITGDAEQYIYDGWHLIEVRKPANPTVATERFVYGHEVDDLVSVEMGGVPYRFLYTPEGFIDALVDPTNTIYQRYDYDLFGKVTVLNAGGVPLLDPAGNPVPPTSRFLFQQRPYDPVTGLYDFRMRWFSSLLGFFLTPDPLGFAAGAAHYTLGDPINGVDRFATQDRPRKATDDLPLWWDIDPNTPPPPNAPRAVSLRHEFGVSVRDRTVVGLAVIFDKFTFGWTGLHKVAPGMLNACHLKHPEVIERLADLTVFGAHGAIMMGGGELIGAGGAWVFGSRFLQGSRVVGYAIKYGRPLLTGLKAALSYSQVVNGSDQLAKGIKDVRKGNLGGLCDVGYGAFNVILGVIGLKKSLPKPPGVIEMHGMWTDGPIEAGGKAARVAPPFPGSNTVVVHGPGVVEVDAGRTLAKPPFSRDFRGLQNLSPEEVAEEIASNPLWKKTVPTTLASCAAGRDWRVAQRVANALTRLGALDPRLRAPTTDLMSENLSPDPEQAGGRWATFLGLFDDE